MTEVKSLLDGLGIVYSDLAMVSKPLDIVRATIPGEQALATWAKLRAAVAESKRWPVLTGGKSNYRGDPFFASEDEEFWEFPNSRQAVEDTLAAGRALDGEAWLRQKAAENEAFIRENEDAEDVTELIGEWPESDEIEPFGIDIHRDLRAGTLHPEVELLLVPCENWWEVPARVGFGGWNACPYPHQHVALFRHWQERYSAELVSMKVDTLELTVAQRPRTPEEAEALAWLMFAYCGDLVSQGTESIRYLAAMLLESDAWYFWWD
jgi:hypothetical protein